MKFTCGECGKNYAIDDSKIPQEGLKIECRECPNQFTIKANKALISTSLNSKRICDNCRQVVMESEKQCPNCNLLFTTVHEDLQIDNKYYESIDPEEEIAEEKEEVAVEEKRSRKPLILVGFLLLIMAGGGFIMATKAGLIGSEKASESAETSKVETSIVVMKSGETYYVDEIKKKGSTLHLTHTSGAKNSVDESEVMMISKGVVEK